MLNRCDYSNCKRDKHINFAVTEKLVDGTLVTKNYCSGTHVVYGILDSWAENSILASNRTLKRAYRTTVAIVKKAIQKLHKEWDKAEDKAV